MMMFAFKMMNSAEMPQEYSYDPRAAQPRRKVNGEYGRATQQLRRHTKVGQQLGNSWATQQLQRHTSCEGMLTVALMCQCFDWQHTTTEIQGMLTER